jgi:DNA-binding LacI/PurR family transcriptional regulator
VANIDDVARLAGVSHQTVSRVLNEEGTVRPVTRAKVERAIAKLNYRPSSVARALATRKSRMIGLISTGAPLYGPSSTALGFNEAAREAGYQVSSASMSVADRSAIVAAVDLLLRQNVEAIVLIAAEFSVLEVIRSIDLGVPLVTAESTGQAELHSVSIDQYRGERQATAHLADLGHRDILHLAGPLGSPDAAERRRGWNDELASRGLPAAEPLVGTWFSESGYELGAELAARWRSAGSPFTAVVSANDQMALGLYHAFADAGIRVPDDVSIVGFDDIPEAAHFSPTLTTVRQDFDMLGRGIMATVLSLIDGSTVTEPVHMQPQLIVRGSTKRLG